MMLAKNIFVARLDQVSWSRRQHGIGTDPVLERHVWQAVKTPTAFRCGEHKLPVFVNGNSGVVTAAVLPNLPSIDPAGINKIRPQKEIEIEIRDMHPSGAGAEI